MSATTLALSSDSNSIVVTNVDVYPNGKLIPLNSLSYDVLNGYSVITILLSSTFLNKFSCKLSDINGGTITTLIALNTLFDTFFRKAGSSTGVTTSINPITAQYNTDGWGLDKTGATYVNTKLQAAVTAVINAGGGTLIMPPGKYKIDAGIPIYINTPDQSTPFRLLGEFVDNGVSVPNTEGTILFSDTAGDMFRINLTTQLYPFISATSYQFKIEFDGLRFEGTAGAATCAIRAYRTRISMSRISAYMLDGLMMQDRTAPNGYGGTWSNYCDQGIYTDIRGVNMKTEFLSLCSPDNTVLTGIRYQYPAAGAVHVMRFYYGADVRINGFLYSDGQHLATVTLQTIIECEGGPGFSASGVHIEEPDAQATFSFINTNGISINGLHERFRGRTLFKFVGCNAATISAWNSWATRDSTYYDIDADATSSDISYHTSYIATYNSSNTSLVRAIALSDPNGVVSKLQLGASVIVVPDAAYTATSSNTVYELPTPTATRVFTSPPVVNGATFEVWNTNTSTSNVWYFDAKCHNVLNVQINATAVSTYYVFRGIGSYWIQVK